MNKTYRKKLTKNRLKIRLVVLFVGVVFSASYIIVNTGLGTVTYMDKLIEPALAQGYEFPVEITEPTKEQVIEEIKKQSVIFGVDTEYALALAKCESGFNYKAKNPKSTARGVYQYLIATWEATESAKQGKERNDYRANIREAMIDLANGEDDKWQQCVDKIK